MNLGIAFDQNYVTAFYALLTSIIETNRGEAITIHAIVSGLSDGEKQQISEFITDNKFEINYYAVNDSKVSGFALSNNWTSAVYYRLFFPLLVPDSVEQLLYLDTDTLILGNLSGLFLEGTDSFPVAAVYDNYVQTAPHIGVNDPGQYFNSGVLLINIPFWNQQQISEKAFQFLNQYPEKIKFVDQDALNAILKNNWKNLDVKYNFMYSSMPEGVSKTYLTTLISNVIVLHFTLHRPWNLLCRNRFRTLYFYYLKKSPLRKKKIIIDFKLGKLPELIKIRLEEFYFDNSILQNFWKKIKSKSIRNN